MIELRAFDALDPALVSTTLAETVTRLQEANPNLELRRGVFAELLAYYHAVLDTQRLTNIEDYRKARSLKAIEEDPTLADPDLVDDVMSNYRLTRKEGRVATGEVTVVVSDDVTVTIAQGSIWEARGRQYVAPNVYTAKAEAAQVILPGDRLLVANRDGNFAFTITVEAVEEGDDYNIVKDTLVAPVAVPPNYVSSYAASDFTPGLAAETNAELLARLQEGIAAKALSNRVNMAAALRAVDAFSRVVAMSIIGNGDGELVRAYHSILPLSLGCRVDWYVRTQEALFRKELTVEAVLVAKYADGTGVWQFAVGKDDAPGFYEFAEIRPANTDTATVAGGFSILSDTRGMDLTGGGYVPDIVNPTEAAYSPYSTAVVQFHDSETNTDDLELGAVQDYSVAAMSLPLIGDVQAHVNSRDVRHYGGDCLVKAPVPCFVQINFTIRKRAGQDDPDIDAIRAAVCGVINRIGFVGYIDASQVSDVVYSFLLDGQTVSAVDMLGRIRYPDPDAELVYMRDSERIVVPDDPANMVTRRTVQFYTLPENVGVSVETAVSADL